MKMTLNEPETNEISKTEEMKTIERTKFNERQGAILLHQNCFAWNIFFFYKFY